MRGGVTTSYLAVVGNGSMWRPGKPRNCDTAYPDGGLTDTVMLVEAGGSNVNWTEPRDFSAGKMLVDGSVSPAGRLSSTHPFLSDDEPAGTWVALADGRETFLPAPVLNSNRVRDLLAVGGFRAEEILPNNRTRIIWTNIAALAVWLASVGLLFYRARRSRKKPIEVVGDSTGTC